MNACVAWPLDCLLGESPVWCPRTQRLYFVDIKGQRLYRHDGDSSGETWPLALPTGSIAPARDGSLIAAQQHGFARITIAPFSETPLPVPLDEPAGNRFNDGKCDAAGRFWAASMDDACQVPSGRIWCLEGKDTVSQHADGFIVGNGFGWSLDNRTMYFTDSENRRIDAYAGLDSRFLDVAATRVK